MNGKFLKIVGLAVFVSAIATFSFADSSGRMNGDRNGVRRYESDRGRGDNHRDDNHHSRNYPYVVGDYGPGAVEVGARVGVIAPVEPRFSLFGVVIIGRPSVGHWETVAEYQTVMKPLYHPAVMGTYWDGYQNIPYVMVPEHYGPEMVPVQEIVYKKVWVTP